MPRYHYDALNSDGMSFSGILRAHSERDAARTLERRGYAAVGEPLAWDGWWCASPR